MTCSWNPEHPITEEVKCPIRFHPAEIKKQSGDFVIKDRILDSDIDRYEKIYKRSYYEFNENYVFCSPECCKAFVLEQKDKKYENSISLLMHVTGKTEKIIPNKKIKINFKQNKNDNKR